MTLEMYAAYLAALAVVLLVPGPTALLVAGYALRDGRASAWRTVPGVALGDTLAMTLSLAGLGAVLMTSAMLFCVFKWAGAAYLIYLGIKMWRSQPCLDLNQGRSSANRCGRAVTAHAFVVTALNPKSILFFVAFMPQFVNPASPVLPQLVLMGVTFLVCAMLAAVLYALLADGLRRSVTRPGTLRAVNRAGGGALVAAGVVTAAFNRSN